MASLVALLVMAWRLKSSPQWKGAKTAPLRIASVTRACTSRLPRREVTRTSCLSRTPRWPASSGWISRNGSRSLRISLGTLPVRVIVCHWSLTRPVSNANGYSSLRISAGLQ